MRWTFLERTSFIRKILGREEVIMTSFAFENNPRISLDCKVVPLRYREYNINLLLTERESRTGEYWPEVVAIRTERSEVRTKTTEGQYSPVWLELARLVSSLLYGTRTMLVLSLPVFENKKIRSFWPFPRKRSVWRNPDQERTNQNARIYLAI